MLLVDPEDCDYGAATDAVRKILYMCDMDWNELFRPARRSYAFRELLYEHFEQLQEYANVSALRSASINVICGDWRSAGTIRELLTMPEVTWAWREALGAVSRRSESVLKSPAALERLVKPPIWHFPGILGTIDPILANRSFLPKELDEKAREIAWRFMCDVDHFAHFAVECELALGLEGKVNPFKKLIEVYRAGAFPIEYAAGEFFVFVP